ncbi:hypothetical protein ELH40_36325 (plasmid) [Rhizobium ruizarguesonis]|uniref:Uncharacterized protein n=1 Tax=Rhizobium ruizarguesonis TaxID=2081791 RepID=A0AB38HS02_9HYPH|nr:hypothetical protein ELH40_36325 [Rhizobium ruizarguesonis]
MTVCSYTSPWSFALSLKKLAIALSLYALTVGLGHAADVVVSSKIDTEGTLLGNVIASKAPFTWAP